MSHYNGWSDVPLTPEETWAERAEAFRRTTAMDEMTDSEILEAIEGRRKCA